MGRALAVIREPVALQDLAADQVPGVNEVRAPIEEQDVEQEAAVKAGPTDKKELIGFWRCLELIFRCQCW